MTGFTEVGSSTAGLKELTVERNYYKDRKKTLLCLEEILKHFAKQHTCIPQFNFIQKNPFIPKSPIKSRKKIYFQEYYAG